MSICAKSKAGVRDLVKALGFFVADPIEFKWGQVIRDGAQLFLLRRSGANYGSTCDKRFLIMNLNDDGVHKSITISQSELERRGCTIEANSLKDYYGQ